MPEMDGYETTQSVRDKRSNVLNHEVPIIAMTADTLDVARKRCIDAGMDRYISKPIKIKELYSEIINLFDDLEFRSEQDRNGGGTDNEQ